MLHTVKKNMYEPKGKSLVIRLKLALLRSVRLEDQGHCLLQTPGYEYKGVREGENKNLDQIFPPPPRLRYPEPTTH